MLKTKYFTIAIAIVIIGFILHLSSHTSYSPIVYYQNEYARDCAKHNENCELFIPIRNTGNSPLVLSEFSTACACSGLLFKNSAGDYSRFDFIEIMPGDEVIAKLILIANGKNGSTMISAVRFKSNDRNNPLCEIKYIIKSVLAELECYPPVIDFGRYEHGKKYEQDIIIYGYPQMEIKNLAVECSVDSRIKIEKISDHAEVRHINGRIYGKYKIRFNADNYNDLNCIVSVRGDDKVSSLTIYATGFIEKPITVAPTALTLKRGEKKKIAIYADKLLNNPEDIMIYSSDSSVKCIIEGRLSGTYKYNGTIYYEQNNAVIPAGEQYIVLSDNNRGYSVRINILLLP